MIIDDFSIENLEKAYQQVKDSIQIEAMHGVVAGIAILLIIDKIIKEYRQAYSNGGGRPDIKSFFDLTYQYFGCVIIILGLPFLISTIESILGNMQTGLIESVGKGDITIADRISDLIDEKIAVYPNGPDLLDGFMAVFDFAMTVVVAPIVYYCTSYLYSMFLCGRYMYLLMLEVVAPVAVVLYLNEKTQQYFFTWLKHMMVCYLMVPFFLFANLFADTVTYTLFNGSVTIWWALTVSFFLKLYLFNMVKSHLQNLI